MRAVVLYLVLRLLITGLSAGGTELGAPSLESPFGIIVLFTTLGAIDLRRRGETLLWANLGYSTFVVWGLFGIVALIGEMLLALLRP